MLVLSTYLWCSTRIRLGYLYWRFEYCWSSCLSFVLAVNSITQ